MKNKKLLITIIEASIMIGLTVALDLVFKEIPILKMPSGGSVSIKLVPLMVYSFRRGPLWGVIASVLYGFIAFLIDGYAFEPFSFFLDYLLAFGITGICGIFRNLSKKNILWFIVGGLCSTVGRLFFSTISGILYYPDMAFGDALVASLVYNAPYILISGVLCIIIVILLRKVIYYELKEN